MLDKKAKSIQTLNKRQKLKKKNNHQTKQSPKTMKVRDDVD